MPHRLALLALAGPAWLAACSNSATEPSAGAKSAPTPIAAHARDAGATAPARLALLVGIDRYAGGREPIEPLAGSVNDVRRVERLLAERFDFIADDVLVLTDEQATHAGIVTAFDRWLIRRAGPDTEVLFWFSGHGSRTPDPDGVEQDGLDSTYVAHDSRAGGRSGEFDIIDDELRSLVAALGRRTRRIAVVTDACHSGAGLRGAPQMRTRALPPGTRALDRELIAPFWPADVELLGDAQRGPDARDPFVHVAACGNRQVAHEVTLDLASEDAPAVHGALTAYLTLALESARPGATWRELAQEAGVRLATRVPAQTVWFEGDVDRRLFDARFEPPPAGYAARSLDAERLLVEAGALHGLRVGAELELFAVGRSEPLGRAEVVSVRGVRGNARWLAPPPAEAGGALRAVERTRPAGGDPLRVRAGDAELSGWIRESACAVPSDGEYEYELARTPQRLELRTAEGLVIMGWGCASADELAALRPALEAELREELRYRALCALAEETGSLRVAARFRAPTAAELARYPGYSSAEPVPGATAAHAIGGLDGDQRLALLEIENTTPEELHVAVLSLAEDRGRNLVFPPPFERDHVLASGQTLTVPVGVQWWPAWNLERPLRDRYLVIATKGYADFQACERGRELRGGAPGDLPELLAQALAPARTRGGPAASVDPAGWGVTAVDLLVRAP